MREVQSPYSQEVHEPATPAPETDGFVEKREGTRAAVDAATKNPFQRFRDLLTEENLLGVLCPRRFGESQMHVRIWHYPERPNILAISFTEGHDSSMADTGLSFDFGQTQPDGTLPYKTGNNTVLFDKLEIIINFLHKKADECGVRLVNVGSGFF